jgi:hypothetical protein
MNNDDDNKAPLSVGYLTTYVMLPASNKYTMIYSANNSIHALDHNLDIKFTLSLLMKVNAIHFTDTNFTQK